MAHLVYDGDCGLCQRSVAWLEAHDGHGRLDARPAAGEADDLQARGLRRRADDTVLWVDGDRVFDESAAAVRVMWHLGGAARFCAALLWLVPKPIRDAGYRWVGRRRHKIAKGEGRKRVR